MQTKIPRARGGFTLVEILVVVIILGIAGAIIVPSIGSRDDLKAAAAARVIMADLIYTQNLAITSQGNRYMSFDTVNQQYTVTDAAGAVIQHPVNHTPYIQKFGGASQSSLPDLKLVSTSFVGISGTAQKIIGFDELNATDLQPAGRDRDAGQRHDDHPGGQIQAESGHRALHRADQRESRAISSRKAWPAASGLVGVGEKMFRLTRTQVQPIGLDIDRDAIKMLQLEVVGDSLAAVAGALKEFPQESKLKAPQRMAMLPEMLRQMLRQNPFVG